jgi:hypothetical protein
MLMRLNAATCFVLVVFSDGSRAIKHVPYAKQFALLQKFDHLQDI